MKFRLILFFVLGLFIFNNLSYTHAIPLDIEGDEMPDSTQRKPNTDSIKRARERIADSIVDARKHIADSTTAARKRKTDSMVIARKHFTDSATTARKRKTDSMTSTRKRFTDSTTAIRKYRESKKFKDSVARAQNTKLNKVKVARQSKLDSMKEARKTITDSISTVRKTRTDSIRTVQKRRTDSLARVQKYKTSKRYADSVTLTRRIRSDSIKAVQKSQRDQVAAIRKYSLDSATKVRKRAMDSIKTVRTKQMDSIKVVRKHRTDSLAKNKKLKEDLAKSKLKKKEESNKLQLDLKLKQKRQAWSNKQMLKKKWGPVRRVTQNSFTHYNYYYNAKKKMDEAQVNMQRTRKENYDSLIGLYPFDPNRDSSLLSSDMDTIVRKISVGIQIHDPRVKWSNDLYLLLGEAYYYRGQYENAAIAFRYIIAKDEEKKKKQAGKHGYSSNKKEGPSILEDDNKSGFLDFLKHKSVHNEAILWLARTYTQAQQVENAESILSLLESDKKLPEDLAGRMAVEKAFAYLTVDNQPAAAEQLAIVIEDNDLPEWLRMRASFIRGQLLQNMGQHKEAADEFEHVLTFYPKIEMDFYARKYVAFNRLEAGENIEESMRPLKKVLNDGKYANYYDQVYYVLGKLAVKANDNKQAITYLTKSTTTPKATKKQKALSFAALGDVYYSSANYPGAKRAYDSAAKYASGTKEAGVATSIQRSKGLEEVSGPSKIIHDQDSLLALSRLSNREQQAAVRKAIRAMEKKIQDSISAAENAKVVSLTPTEPDEPKDGTNWYFSNPTTVQQGSNDFKRKWGNRPLADNWRRSAGMSISNNNNSADDDDDLLADASADDKGMPTEESLLAKIPNTPQQKEQAEKLIQRAYMQLAKAYVKQLEDYKMAVQTMDTLNARYPKHSQKEEELHLRYQIALKQNQLDKAKQYADQLVAQFPNSQYASVVRPKHSESQATEMSGGQTVSQFFDATYSLLMQHQYTEVLMRVTVAKKEFTHPTYQKRFQVVEAMAFAGAGEFDLADTMISRFLKANPTDTLTAWAGTVKNYIKEVRNGGKPSWYKDTPFVPKDTAVAKSDTKSDPAVPPTKPVTPPTPPSDIPPAYAYRADTPHYCIIVLAGIDSRTGGLKKAVRDLNSNNKYSAANLELLFDLYNIHLGVLVVKKFRNAAESKAYMADLLASDALKGYAPGELKVMLISDPNYKRMFKDKTTQPYYGFYNSNYN